jgi:hypothetical protein
VSGKGPHISTENGHGCDTVSDAERLDILMRSIYGRTVDELLAEVYQRGFEAGVKSGKRLAKGKSIFPKSHGRPKLLDDILVLQFIDFVDRMSEDGGIALGAAVSIYRNKMTPLWKELRLRPSQDQLMRLFQKAKRPKFAIDDGVRRAYELLKRGPPST